MAEFKRVASVNDLKPGQTKSIEVDGELIALYNVNGNFYATTNTCLHQEGPLGEGTLEGETVTCPWHGWKFNVRTGVSPVVPTAKIQTYAVKIEGDDILVAID